MSAEELSDEELKAFGRLIKRERDSEKLTQDALEALTRQLGSPVKKDLISRIERGEKGRGNFESRDALCRALGGTYVCFVRAAAQDAELKKMLEHRLDKLSQVFPVLIVARRTFDKTADAKRLPDLVIRLIDDLREDGVDCRKFITNLAAKAPTSVSEDQCNVFTQVVCLLAACAYYPLPSIDGAGVNHVPKSSQDWTKSGAIDASQHRSVSIQKEHSETSEFPKISKPRNCAHFPPSPDLQDEEQTIIRLVEAVNDVTGGIIDKDDLVGLTPADSQYSHKLEKHARRLNRQIRALNDEIEHIFLSSSLHETGILKRLKRNYLPDLRVFNDGESEGIPLLHCDDDVLEDYFRVCFRSIKTLEQKIPENRDSPSPDVENFEAKIQAGQINQLILSETRSASINQSVKGQSLQSNRYKNSDNEPEDPQ